MAAREDARRAAAQQAAEEEAAAAAEAEAAAEAAQAAAEAEAAEAEAAGGGLDSDTGAPSGFDLSRSNEARPSTSCGRAAPRAVGRGSACA